MTAEHFFGGLAIACLVLLVVLIAWCERPLPRCKTCGRRHVDNPPARIGGYQPCPRPTVPANLPPKHP